jgi:sensor histidine kinase regulating citrate/malate metabolism
MSWRARMPRIRFATQALLAQVAVLLLIVGAAFGLVAMKLRAELETQYEQRALAVAQAVAADPVIASALESGSCQPARKPSAMRRTTSGDWKPSGGSCRTRILTRQRNHPNAPAATT